uniref:P/Homo B domain-containing protein n=1 Tax=Rodentolepis nana TaxID=102285 RepID=A0A0R3TAG8_RODNA
LEGDNCGADGIVNHPSVIGVSALSENGLSPSYGEACAAVAVAVPVGGAEDEFTFRAQLNGRRLFAPTTKINNMCTTSFVGTSASNPMAAGIVALAMEANPNLQPRDVSAIIALSGRIPTASATGIYINGGGYLVSHIYGSGLLNTVRVINLAKTWIPLGPRRMCIKYKGGWTGSRNSLLWRRSLLKLYPHKTARFTFSFTPDNCDVEVIEVVRVGMQWLSEHRGSLEVKLTSPSGQKAYLLYPRIKDHFKGKSEMIWKSVMHTGESSYGSWTISVRDTGRRGNRTRRSSSLRASGGIFFIGIELHGTLRNESAFQQNNANIIKHWHPDRLAAYKANVAVTLNTAMIAELYDRDRWDALFEKVEQ